MQVCFLIFLLKSNSIGLLKAPLHFRSSIINDIYKTHKRSHSIFGLVKVTIVLFKSKYFKFILILTNSSNNKIELQYTSTRN